MKVVAIALLVLLIPLGQVVAQDQPADDVAEADVPAETFREYLVPHIDGAPEPTIGIPWNTDSVFYHAGFTTVRAVFDDDHEATWTDVTAPHQSPINVDPMLHADPDTGRAWAGGLAGPCSYMLASDDDGETWINAGNMCSGLRFDHQSIGSGPHALPVANPLHAHAAYYCGQLGTIACATSYDGGQAWGPFMDVPGDCGGFHGHIRVSRATGFVAVPVGRCGSEHGFISTANSGVTWTSNRVPGSPQWTNGFDPSLQFSRPSGWMYYGMAGEHGIHMAMTKDQGASWETLGSGHNVTETWFDVGAVHDPPIVAGTFADVQVGDDDRVAFSFLGIEGGPDADLDYLNSDQIYACDERQDELIWHYYVALSYDAGQTWDVHKLTEDPVQVGGVFDVVVNSSGCRNLLDFNDMDIDSKGRVHIAWADGCVRQCAETQEPDTDGYREREGKLFRQVSGKGLFAAFDGPERPNNTTTNHTADPVTVEAPGLAFIATAGVAFVLLAAAVRRRP